eukprot:1161593-Pelagomonas_calceolata.AAC.13
MCECCHAHCAVLALGYELEGDRPLTRSHIFTCTCCWKVNTRSLVHTCSHAPGAGSGARHPRCACSSKGTAQGARCLVSRGAHHACFFGGGCDDVGGGRALQGTQQERGGNESDLCLVESKAKMHLSEQAIGFSTTQHRQRGGQA